MTRPCVTFIYTVAGAGIVPKDSYTDRFRDGAHRFGALPG